MKVFREENGVKTVYVQKNDLARLIEFETLIPAALIEQIFKGGCLIVDDSNRFEFVSFHQPESILFFKQIDWILDYDDFSRYSEVALQEKHGLLSTRMEEIISTWESMTAEEKRRNFSLGKELEQKNYMRDTIEILMELNGGTLSMPIPSSFETQKQKNRNFLEKVKKYIFGK